VVSSGGGLSVLGINGICSNTFIDERGYLALDQQTSNLFYQVISTWHSQKKSTVITTKTPFSD